MGCYDKHCRGEEVGEGALCRCMAMVGHWWMEGSEMDEPLRGSKAGLLWLPGARISAYDLCLSASQCTVPPPPFPIVKGRLPLRWGLHGP